ncbi:MAG: hypothetical protein ACO4CG_16200, partial [Prochlorothrix sp.]
VLGVGGFPLVPGGQDGTRGDPRPDPHRLGSCWVLGWQILGEQIGSEQVADGWIEGWQIGDWQVAGYRIDRG